MIAPLLLGLQLAALVASQLAALRPCSLQLVPSNLARCSLGVRSLLHAALRPATLHRAALQAETCNLCLAALRTAALQPAALQPRSV